MKSKTLKIRPLSQREIERRRVALRKVFAEIDADPKLKAALKRWTKAMSH